MKEKIKKIGLAMPTVISVFIALFTYQTVEQMKYSREDAFENDKKRAIQKVINKGRILDRHERDYYNYIAKYAYFPNHEKNIDTSKEDMFFVRIESSGTAYLNALEELSSYEIKGTEDQIESILEWQKIMLEDKDDEHFTLDSKYKTFMKGLKGAKGSNKLKGS
jgi:hypothetical protein